MRTLLLCLVLAAPARADEPVRVCATTPNLASLVRIVGGDRVRVHSFTRAGEDPHHVEAKPSYVRKLHDAELLFAIGLELEIGWLPVLQQSARNPRVQAGEPGFVDCSRAVEALEVPRGAIDRSMGDVHAPGTPHYLLDPERGRAVARLIRDKLAATRPGSREHFASRCKAFEKRLSARAEDWKEKLGRFSGAPVVVDHTAWIYLLERFGLKRAVALEPKPGVRPSARHLKRVAETVKEKNVRVVIRSPSFPAKSADWVARATGARVVVLAHQVGALEEAGDYVALLDENVRRLAAALKDE